MTGIIPVKPFGCFNPLPSPKQGETSRCKSGTIYSEGLGFNPLPSPKQGETPSDCRAAIGGANYHFVSIRSPHRSKGRRPKATIRAVQQCSIIWFQSAPLTEARGDSPAARNRRRQFNGPKQGDYVEGRRVSIRSPHRSKGRRAPARREAKPNFQVSIRSPHRSKGRLCRCACLTDRDIEDVSIRSPHRSKGRQEKALLAACTQLQSDRSDQHPYLPPRRQQRFNPLPSPKQGETRSAPSCGTQCRSFNPLPSPKQGETSAIPPCKRGRCFNPLPSPKQGETVLARCVSIRSPHRSKGREQVRHFLRASHGSFNPLPSPKQGETSAAWLSSTGFRLPAPVSIRSPHRSKGRLRGPRIDEFQSAPLKQGETGEKARMCTFQSAPLTEARGDHCPTSACAI